jgi:hypothetical protein
VGCSLTSQVIRVEKVLVDCAAGSSRPPNIVALQMDVVGYENFNDALSPLRELRHVVAQSKLVVRSAKPHLQEMI